MLTGCHIFCRQVAGTGVEDCGLGRVEQVAVLVQRVVAGSGAAGPHGDPLQSGCAAEVDGFGVVGNHELAELMGVSAEANHANAGVEGCAHTHEGCAGVFEASGEHAQYAAGVLVGVLVGYLDEFAVVFAVEDAQGGLVGVEGFGNAQVVEFDVSGVDAVAGACW